MSGSTATNDQAVQFEQQQAADAAAKEQQRQQRLSQGQAAINAIFEGQPVMGTRSQNFDWSSFKPPAAGQVWNGQVVGGTPGNAPAGYTAVMATRPSRPATGAVGGASTPLRGVLNTAGRPVQSTSSAGTWQNTGRGAQQFVPANVAGQGAGTWQNTGKGAQQFVPSTSASTSMGLTGGLPEWALRDASGKLYFKGDPLSYNTSYDTGQRTGGFGDDFYRAYGQKYLDYYQPAESKQYAEAKRDLGYGLENQGIQISSAAADRQGQLAYQHDLNIADIQNKANQAEGDLQSQIQSEKQSLINQLYATEDPTLTANLAQSAAQGFQLKTPTLTPGAAFFAPALTATTTAAGNIMSPYGPYASQYGYGQGQGTVAPANASSGKPYSSN
jgi:hypothetical protein